LGFGASIRLVMMAGSGDAAGVLALLGLLCAIVGVVGLASLLFFDLVLRRYAIPDVVRDLAQLVVIVAVFVGILYRQGLDAISLAATGGVLTAVIGFALQSTIANVFAGVALPLERQGAIGGWVSVRNPPGRNPA